jgi:hypothetical protein
MVILLIFLTLNLSLEVMDNVANGVCVCGCTTKKIV